MSKGSGRRPTLKKEQAEANWAIFEENAKAKKSTPMLDLLRERFRVAQETKVLESGIDEENS